MCPYCGKEEKLVKIEENPEVKGDNNYFQIREIKGFKFCPFCGEDLDLRKKITKRISWSSKQDTYDLIEENFIESCGSVIADLMQLRKGRRHFDEPVYKKLFSDFKEHFEYLEDDLKRIKVINGLWEE